MKTVFTDQEATFFRWAYAAVVDVAKACLAKANAEREDEYLWPAGQSWSGLSGSSKAVFMHQAREKLGIDHRVFLDVVRSCEIDGLDEIFDSK